MAKLASRTSLKDRIRIKPERSKELETAEKLRTCAKKGCMSEGGYRVPKSRQSLNEHIWFCLAHAREHNESWDYFRGMSESEIEAFRNEAVTGHRPTWPLGKRSARMHNPYGSFHFDDAFGAIPEGEAATKARPPRREVSRLQIQAFDMLNLEPSATLNEIKARYKELVKRFHPDANGGDRGAEERLKQVIKAYGVLRASGLT